MISKYAKVLAGIGALLLLAFAMGASYQHGYTVAQTKGEADLNAYKAQQTQASLSALGGAFQGYVANVARGQQAESRFLGIQQSADDQAKSIKGAIDAVTQPRAMPLVSSQERVVYRCVFSPGFVRLWNAAAGLDAGSAELLGAAPAGSASNASAADATADSGVSQGDILDWFVDYSNRARRVEGQLNAVIAAHPDGE